MRSDDGAQRKSERQKGGGVREKRKRAYGVWKHAADIVSNSCDSPREESEGMKPYLEHSIRSNEGAQREREKRYGQRKIRLG